MHLFGSYIDISTILDASARKTWLCYDGAFTASGSTLLRRSQSWFFTDSLHLVAHFLMEREKEFLAIVVNFWGLGTKNVYFWRNAIVIKVCSIVTINMCEGKGISMGAVENEQESIWSAPHFRLINGIGSNSHILAVFRTCSKPKAMSSPYNSQGPSKQLPTQLPCQARLTLVILTCSLRWRVYTIQ